MSVRGYEHGRGFTFVELLFVAMVIGLLAAIAVPNFIEARTRAEVSRTRATMATLANAIENYRVDHRSYPLNPQPRVTSQADLLVLTTPVAYLTSLPDFPEGPRRRSVRMRAVYVNLGQIYPKEDPFQIPDEATGGYGLYSLTVNGPDGTLRLDTEQEPVQYEFYDPTNGTNSRGDHNLFGP